MNVDFHCLFSFYYSFSLSLSLFFLVFAGRPALVYVLLEYIPG